MQIPMKAEMMSWKPKGDLDTPYKRARQEWDNRIGSSAVQARTWRLIAFAMLFFVAMPAVGGMIWLGSQPTKVPYIVEVARDGSAISRGEVGKAWESWKPTDPSIRYHLQRFIQDTRMISSDGAVVKRNWLDAYKLVTASGSNTLNAYVQKSDPFVRIATERVSVEVLSMVQLSQESWQVDWKESVWGIHGEPLGDSYWRGIFRIMLKQPRTEEQFASNPIGLYIDEFHWSRINR
jgi:type IV secretion system protein TrbF